jgi:large subunit ribosomal protein L4
MPTANVYNLQGEAVSTVELPAEIFGTSDYDHLLHTAVRYSQAARRQGTASTKSRNEVRGGGKKMWKQKGTGRARHGGTRAPQFRGGGVAHGPKPRSYFFKLNRKVRRNALKGALSARATTSCVSVFETLDVSEIKTRPVAALLRRLGIESALVVVGESNGKFALSARNIPRIKVLESKGLNVEDVLRHKHLVLTRSSVERIIERMKP